MKLIKKITVSALSVATVAALALGGTTAANADPIGSPADRPLRGVGSDTTQDLYNGLSQVLFDAPGDKYISSFNATPIGSTIKTWSGGTTFNRPDGSSAGVKALRSAIDTSTTLLNGTTSVNLNHNDVNFARSSSGATWLTGTTKGALTYLPYAADGVTWATTANSILPTTIPVGSTTDATTLLTLRNIYAGNVTSYTSGGTTINLHPLLPQDGSGTRKYFTDTVLAGTTINTSVVKDVYGTANTPVQENSGAPLLDGSYIVPFSIGSFIEQTNAATLNAQYSAGVLDRRGAAELQQVSTSAPLAAGGVLNPAFPLKRVVFTVVETAAITTGNALYNADLASTFVGASGSAYTQDSPYSGNKVFEDFGFNALPLTISGSTYTVGSTAFTIN